jgi:hypothetical protein
VSEDPRFTDADGADNVLGTHDDDLTLRTDSPAVDQGENDWINANADLGGAPRFVDGNHVEESPGVWATVDMGAREMALALRHLPADDVQTACPACAVQDCSACSSGACNDGKASLCETIAYACAWKNGCNDDLAGMTRSAYIWRSGECYCWEYWDGDWYPSTCLGATELHCGSNAGGGVAAADSGSIHSGDAALLVEQPGDGSANLTLRIKPHMGVSAVAAEVPLPRGWEVVAIGEGGQLDALHRKIKFGPFLDGSARTPSVTMRRSDGEGQARNLAVDKHELLSRSAALKSWAGTVSFDGNNQPVAAVIN